jgi:hypothetical protein
MDEDTGEYLGKCALCDSIGPTGLYCISIFCEVTGAVYENPFNLTLSPTRSSSPEGNLASVLNLTTYSKDTNGEVVVSPTEQPPKQTKKKQKKKSTK